MIAAAAEAAGLVVLHYDDDYDRIARVTLQPVEWVARKVIEGVPVVVVQGGRPIEPALRLERVTLDELLESARNQGITNLRDIELAILEPSGKFSFLKQNEGSEPQGAPDKHKG